jgi:pimeloyl-ACP methyl ester carboxylesterase
MAQVSASGKRIEYETFGVADDPALLLVMGLGGQLIHWRSEFCSMLAERGHYVIRFDNRDCGLSEKFGHLGEPNVFQLLTQVRAGESVNSPYTLEDMSSDAVELLDALDIEAAHICGASMGGMIAQTMAITAPERVLTMTSIMSTTGDPELPPASGAAMAALFRPPATTRAEAAERALEVGKVIGSPVHQLPAAIVRERAVEAFDRSHYPEGVMRQMAAVVVAKNRRAQLEKLSLPALVIHCEKDPLVPIEHGKDTHEALAGSRMLAFDDMGHDLPEPRWPEIVDGISELTGRS